MRIRTRVAGAVVAGLMALGGGTAPAFADHDGSSCVAQYQGVNQGNGWAHTNWRYRNCTNPHIRTLTLYNGSRINSGWSITYPTYHSASVYYPSNTTYIDGAATNAQVGSWYGFQIEFGESGSRTCFTHYSFPFTDLTEGGTCTHN